MPNKELSGAQLSLISLSKCGTVTLAKSSVQRDAVKRNQRNGKSFQYLLFHLKLSWTMVGHCLDTESEEVTLTCVSDTDFWDHLR